MQRLYNAAAGYEGISAEQIAAQKVAREKIGKTFDPLSYIKDTLSEADYAVFCSEFVLADEPPVLYEDAERFLDLLQETDVPHIILTFGDNYEWQVLKLAAAGYPVGRGIMENSDKGGKIENLRSEDGKFHFRVHTGGVARYHADSMILIDDKSIAFNSLPEDCTGFKVKRGEELPNQQGPVPDRVETIESFDELTVTPDGRLKRKEEGDPAPLRQTFWRRWRGYAEGHLDRIPIEARIASYVPLDKNSGIREQYGRSEF
jgi:hypothetical protein